MGCSVARIGRGLLQGLLILSCAPLPAQSSTGARISSVPLQNTSGRTEMHRVGDGRLTVLLFFSTRCPLSNAFNYRRNELYRKFGRRVRFLMIDPNANESLAEVRAYAKQSEFDLPVYRDEDGAVADELHVRATTDSFVLDRAGVVRYQGSIENAANAERATQHGLKAALTAVLAGKMVAEPVTAPMGCAVRHDHAYAK